MKYLLDTSVFIEAKKTYYAFDICPGFWNWIKTSENLQSIVAVKQEIMNGNDFLKDWVSDNLSNAFFLPRDQKIQGKYAEIAEYVMGLPDDYIMKGKLDFLKGADGWLIAAAEIFGCTIITYEHYDVRCRKKVLIPNVAEHYQVRCIDVFTALREMKVQFN